MIVPGEWVQYAIENIQTFKLVGDCAIYLHQADSRIAEVGITISHLYHKQGYARETMSAIMDFIPGKGIHRIVETRWMQKTKHPSDLKSLCFLRAILLKISSSRAMGSEYLFAMLRKEWENRDQGL